MKRALKCLFLVALFAIVATSEDNCDNAMWAHNPAVKRLLLNVSVPITEDDFCPEIGGSETTCCGEEIYDQMEELYDDALDKMRRLRNQMSAFDPDWDKIREQINDARVISEKNKQALNTLVDDTEELVEALPDASYKCMRGSLKYVAGMYCFACAPDWKRFTEKAGLLGLGLKLRLQENTCVKIWEECEDLISIIKDYVRNLAKFVRDILSANGSPDMPGDSVCDGDCKEIVCSRWIRGINFIFPARSMLLGWGKRSESPAIDAWAELEVTHITPLLDIMGEKSKRDALQVDGENVYADDGFPAYEVGKASGFDTDSGEALLPAMGLVFTIMWFVFFNWLNFFD